MYVQLDAMFEKTFPFWEKLDEADKTALKNATSSVSFKKGTNIHDGNECTGVIIVKKGCLRIYLLSEDGKEITLYRLFSGGMCMLSASCVIQAITFDVFVDSEEDCECVVVRGNVFNDIAEKYHEAKIFALETAVERFSEVMWVMQQILFMSMDKRLAIFLLDESSKTGSDVIKLTHEQIAKYMGSAREVVSRMLKYFSTEGMISSSRSEGIKLLDKTRLRELAL